MKENTGIYECIRDSSHRLGGTGNAIANLASVHGMRPESLKTSYYRWLKRKGVTPNTTNKSTPGLAEDEQAVLDNYRKEKTILEEECRGAGINVEDVRHWWYKSKLISAFVKTNKPQKTVEDLKMELVDGMKQYSPKFTKIVRERIKDPHCLVIDPADIHIGKLGSSYETGEDYNNIIAVKRVKECLDKILVFTNQFPVDKICLIIGNDILHTDTPRHTTTSGTPQDTDGQWYTNFMIAQKLYIHIIERLMVVADVHVIHNVSNHDYMTGWFLAQATHAWFRNSKNITFDCDMRHRKAYVYGENLIGSTHGDGAKNTDLPLLLAQEFKKEWASTTHRYIYTHHVHHKQAKEIIGVTVETSRSVSGADGYHHRNGYQHAMQAMEAYLHHFRDGQIARFTAISTKK